MPSNSMLCSDKYSKDFSNVYKIGDEDISGAKTFHQAYGDGSVNYTGVQIKDEVKIDGLSVSMELSVATKECNPGSFDTDGILGLSYAS